MNPYHLCLSVSWLLKLIFFLVPCDMPTYVAYKANSKRTRLCKIHSKRNSFKLQPFLLHEVLNVMGSMNRSPGKARIWLMSLSTVFPRESWFPVLSLTLPLVYVLSPGQEMVDHVWNQPLNRADLDPALRVQAYS